MNLPILRLSDTDRERLEQLLDEFDQHWTPHHLGIVAGQLHTESPEFKAATLTELVKVDLDYRQRQEPTRIEWYIKRFPELGESPEILCELLQAEIEVWQAAGEPSTLANLKQRFPSLQDQLEAILVKAAQETSFSQRHRAKRKEVDREMHDPTLGSTASIASSERETLPPSRRKRSDSGQSADSLDVQFGRYRLLQELGRGAMGTVYLAEDTELRRHVALKRPRVAETEEVSILERFYREAYAAATLDHPNICPVYDIGEHDGIPYITMAHVEGKTLSRVIRESRGLNSRAVALLVRKIALALAEAHEKGVIHRDLKPGNIMLNHRSEPVVMDFGLARQVEYAEDRLSVEGMLIGTPGYMSPEQVDGDLEAVGRASDIYSLGVVLFELLTGKLPFQGSVAAVIGKILRDAPPAPSSLRAGVPQQLEEVCLKMMAKSPADRYATMSDVAEVLGAFIKSGGEGASAASPPPIEQTTPAQLAGQQKQLAQMITDGLWREASVHLQRMSELRDPVAAPYAHWARDQAAALHVRWQEEQQAAGLALATAKEQFKGQDYMGAAQTLLAVNKQLLNAEAQQILDQSLKLQEEVDLLIHLIEQGLNGGTQAGMFKNMQRLLQLKPKDRLVHDLYRKFRWQQRLGWFGATLADAVSLAGGRKRSIHDEPILRKWLAMAAVVFLISFGLMTWVVMSYLKDDREIAERSAEIAVDVDESHAELNESSGSVVSEAEATPTKDSFDAPSITSDTQPLENEPLVAVTPAAVTPAAITPPAVTPPAVDADRAAAEWVISNGGVVVVDIRKNLRIDKLADLPQEQFRVISVIFSNKSPDATEMDALAKLGQLLTVTLMGGEITDKHLHWLTKAPKFQSLGLADCDISELGLQYVSNIEGLQRLTLARTKVTDSGLMQLRNMEELVQVTLTQTAVTNVGVFELERALPKCEVIWDGRPQSTGYKRPKLPQIAQQPLKITTHGLPGVPRFITSDLPAPPRGVRKDVFAMIRGAPRPLVHWPSRSQPPLAIKEFALEVDVELESRDPENNVWIDVRNAEDVRNGKWEGEWFRIRVLWSEERAKVMRKLMRFRGLTYWGAPEQEADYGEPLKITLLVGADQQMLFVEGETNPLVQRVPTPTEFYFQIQSYKATKATIHRFVVRALTDEEKLRLSGNNR